MLMKFEFSRQVFENIEIPSFMKIRRVGIVPCGRTDRHTEGPMDRKTDGQKERQAGRQAVRHHEAYGRFSQFCGRA
jgi:hypothetical protein